MKQQYETSPGVWSVRVSFWVYLGLVTLSWAAVGLFAWCGYHALRG